MSDYELYHYGVLGMKWGVRKNPKKAYIKAVKQQNRFDNAAKYNQKKLKTAEEAASRAKSELDKNRHDLEEARLKKELAGYELRDATRRYGDGKNDIFGFKADNLNKANIKNIKATKMYDDANARVNKSLLDSNAKNDAVNLYSARAKEAVRKSEKWKASMESAFKDVPRDVIDAGDEWLRSHGYK